MTTPAPSPTHHRALALVITALAAIGLARTVPRASHAATAATTADASVDASTHAPQSLRGPHLLDPNTSSLVELETLPSVGPAMASRIVTARTNAPFRRADDLLRVRGIGPRTLEHLRPWLRFDQPDASATDPQSSEAPRDR